MIFGNFGEICRVCGEELTHEDTSYTHGHGIEVDDFNGCENCVLEHDYINSEIMPIDTIFYNKKQFGIFNTEIGVIVVVEDKVISELDELNGDLIASLVEAVLRNGGSSNEQV